MTKVWLKSIKNEQAIRQTSECTKREFEKYLQGSRKLLQAHEKVYNKNERDKQRKNNVCYCWKEALYRVHTKNR